VGQNGNTGGGRSLSKKDWDFLRAKALWGHEVNRCTYRMDLLNVYLHGIDEPNLRRIDTLGPGTHVGRSYDVVAVQSPYGAKVVNGAQRRQSATDPSRG
jgi:type I restriction-modification system DNA methylase subunit